MWLYLQCPWLFLCLDKAVLACNLRVGGHPWVGEASEDNGKGLQIGEDTVVCPWGMMLISYPFCMYFN